MNESNFKKLSTKILLIIKAIRLQQSCEQEASGLSAHLEGFGYLKCESYWLFNGI